MEKEQDIENIVDWYACQQCDPNSIYDEIDTIFRDNKFTLAQKGKKASECPVVQLMIHRLFLYRIEDPNAFDVLCLKTLHPELTHVQIIQYMKGNLREDYLHVRAIWTRKSTITDVMRRVNKMKENLANNQELINELKLMKKLAWRSYKTSATTIDKKIEQIQKRRAS